MHFTVDCIIFCNGYTDTLCMIGENGGKVGKLHNLTCGMFWNRLDKTKFHVIGAILFTAQSALLHPTSVVKTRMQVVGSELSHMRGISAFTHILRTDGIPGIFRGFGTSAIGSIPGRVLVLSSLEASKEMSLKYLERFNLPEATRLGIANGMAGMLSNLVSCVYYVPLDVVGKFGSHILFIVLLLLCSFRLFNHLLYPCWALMY